MNIYIPPIIEKVYNVQGSTAGAGSGEFHRYRAMRRRERARIAAMEKEYHERKMQKEFEERKIFINEMFEKKRDKKREMRKKKEDKKKMIKKCSKLAEGVNKYAGVNGNFLEEFQKEVEMNPEILKKNEEDERNNFDEFDYKLEAPKIKKSLKKEEENPEVQKDLAEKEEDQILEDEDDYYLEDLKEFEKEMALKREKEKLAREEANQKVKELPKNVIIYDSDM